MGITKILTGIIKHPLSRNSIFKSITRFITWQIRIRLIDKPLIFTFTPHSKLQIVRGMKGATGNYYSGLHEFDEMAFLLHFLRKEDTFIDVGANVGSYTVLASAEVGAKSYAFEPIPDTFAYLQTHIRLNHIEENVRAQQIGISSEKKQLYFTTALDTENHIQYLSSPDSILIEVDSLDGVLRDVLPTLIKIDVEGFESEVIAGANQTLMKESLKAVIIELTGIGSNYGHDENLIHEHFVGIGFQAYRYDGIRRILSASTERSGNNVIYIRDIEFVQERIKHTPQIKILNTYI